MEHSYSDSNLLDDFYIPHRSDNSYFVENLGYELLGGEFNNFRVDQNLWIPPPAAFDHFVSDKNGNDNFCHNNNIEMCTDPLGNDANWNSQVSFENCFGSEIHSAPSHGAGNFNGKVSIEEGPELSLLELIDLADYDMEKNVPQEISLDDLEIASSNEFSDLSWEKLEPTLLQTHEQMSDEMQHQYPAENSVDHDHINEGSVFQDEWMDYCSGDTSSATGNHYHTMSIADYNENGYGYYSSFMKDSSLPPDVICLRYADINNSQVNLKLKKGKSFTDEEKEILRNAVKRQLICKQQQKCQDEIEEIKKKVGMQYKKRGETNTTQTVKRRDGRSDNHQKIQKLEKDIEHLEGNADYVKSLEEKNDLEEKIKNLQEKHGEGPLTHSNEIEIIHEEIVHLEDYKEDYSYKHQRLEELQKTVERIQEQVKINFTFCNDIIMLYEKVEPLEPVINKYQQKIMKLRSKLDNLYKKKIGILTYSNQIEKLYERIEKLNNFEDPRHERFIFSNESFYSLDQIDFELIAKEYFSKDQGKYVRHAPELAECWQHSLRPNLKTDKFTSKERNILKELLKDKLDESDINWGEIAEKLAHRTKSKLKRGELELYKFFKSIKDRQYGWTDECNHELTKSVTIYKEETGSEKVAWKTITHKFSGRSKSQVYSHWRYLNKKTVRPEPYSKAELEVIRTAINLQFPHSQIVQLLGNKRTIHQIMGRERLLTQADGENIAALMASADESMTSYEPQVKSQGKQQLPINLDKQQLTFRKKINRLFEKYDLLDGAIVRNDVEIPASLTDEILQLINEDPQLVIGKVIKPKGKPGRKKKAVGLIRQLRDIIRPLYVIKNRRKRITSYPGDGREHGLVLFALYRLLAVDYDRTKTPSVSSSPSELDEAGISRPDHTSYTTMIEIIDSLPVELFEQETARYLAGVFPTLESLLPPTLHTLNGLRGLLVYQDSLITQSQTSKTSENGLDQDDSDQSQESTYFDPFSNADRRLFSFMESLFYHTGELVKSELEQSLIEKHLCSILRKSKVK